MTKKERIVAENKLLLQLWNQTQSGDQVAFRHLVDRVYRSLFNYAHTFTSDREFIKDAIQELLISIWKKRQSIHMEYVIIYFLTSLRNQLFQEFRKSGSIRSMVDIESCNEIADSENIEEAIIGDEIITTKNSRIRHAIGSLPRRQQEVVFLRFYQGLDNEKIAAVMQINRQSVANLLFKAISALKVQIH